MSHISTNAQNQDIEAQERTNKTLFGFWIYLMTDLILFATLFATFLVLRNNTFGGEPASELFSLSFVLTETTLLLVSSYICGLAMLAAYKNKIRLTVVLLGMVFALGAAFVAMELYEFTHLVREGNSWQRSGFLSAFFTLVGTHGAHITAGLIWLAVVVTQIIRRGFTVHTMRRLAMFSLFWHFLDVVWIFIFTIVYLMGAL